MKRLVVACLLFGALYAPAADGRVVTWETTSRFVDPRVEPLSQPGLPPGSVHSQSLRVNVRLPRGYDGRRRFPVIYLLHPHGSNADSWKDPGQGDALRLLRDIPAIVVMPEGGVGYYVNWWRGGTRRPGWARYYLDELMPMVERRLRVRRARRWHAIGGFSMGGFGAAVLAAMRPGYFGSVVSLSGPLNIQRPEWPGEMDFDSRDYGVTHEERFGDPAQQAFYWSGHNPTALLENYRYTRLYVGVGDGIPRTEEEANDYGGAIAERVAIRPQNDDFAQAATEAGLDLTYEPGPGNHNWPRTRERFARAIDWGLFKPVVARPRRWTYDTVQRRGNAWGFRYRFARPPQSVVRLSRSRLRLRGSGGRGRVRIVTPSGEKRVLRLPFDIRLER